MLSFTAKAIIGITVGLLFLVAVLMALLADVFATDTSKRRQKPTPLPRNRLEWVRSYSTRLDGETT